MKRSTLLVAAALASAVCCAKPGDVLPGFAAFAPDGARRFTFDFAQAKPGENRIAFDVPYAADLSKVKHFAYEVKVDGLDAVNAFAVFFKAGKGWYGWGAGAPEYDAKWARGVVSVGNLRREGNVAGLDKIDGFRIYVNRPAGTSPRIVATFRGFVEVDPSAWSFEKDDPAALARLAALPPKPGERRLAWCHSAWGMSATNDWESSVAFLKENGFTDLIANLSWAGEASYASAYAPVSKYVAQRGDALEACKAACRRHGVKLHVWRVCYRLRGGAPALDAFREKMVAENRCVGVEDRGRKDWWLCPSDPRNQQLEIDAMVELAGKGVDGIHFDYIRHRDSKNCNCENCRARFEAQEGVRFANWPADLAKPEWAAKWRKFREDAITKVVRTASQRVRAKYPNVEISAAVQQPWASMAQDWPLWCRENLLDFACPMDYTHSARIFARQIAEQRAYVEGSRTKIYPGIGLSSSFGWPRDGDDARRLAEHVEAVRNAGYDGFTLFNFDRRCTRLMPYFKGK